MNRDHRLQAIRELPPEMLADDALGLAGLYPRAGLLADFSAFEYFFHGCPRRCDPASIVAAVPPDSRLCRFEFPAERGMFLRVQPHLVDLTRRSFACGCLPKRSRIHDRLLQERRGNAAFSGAMTSWVFFLFPWHRCASRGVVEGHAAGEVYRKESNDWARKEASRS